MTAPRRLLALAAGLGLLTLLAASVPARAATAPGDPTTAISRVSTHGSTVQFVFSAGNLPAGSKLVPDSVTVTAGGQTLPASATEADAATDHQATAAREVILALDVSGSMKGDGIAAARAAATSYIAGLPDDVRVGLLTFADHATLRVAPTTNRAAVAAAISAVRAGGGTALYDGIVAAATALHSLPPDSSRRLLILSDGDDTSSTHSLADALTALDQGKIAADVVAFRLPSNRAVLNRIATQSGGKSLAAGNAAELAGAFGAAAAQFQQQLLVTVHVPAALSGQKPDLSVAVNAGTRTVSAHRVVQLPTVSGAHAPALAVSVPTGSTGHAQLWVTLALVFVGLLAILLYLLLMPVLHAERARKQARLAEVNRYRVVEVLGGPEAAAAAAGESHSAIAQAALAAVDKVVRARGRRGGVVDELERAGLRMRPEEWIVLQLAAVVVVAAVLGLLAGPIGLLLGAVLGWLAMRVLIRTRIRRRANAFGDQLPDTLQLIAGALRTGFSLNQALVGVVREGTEPTASEFARTLTEVRLGADLEDALDGTADRMECADLHWVVLAVRISREVGGNLAEVVTTTMRTMRQRAELRGQVRVLSAEGRISARILTALPLFVGGGLLLFNRGYLAPLVNQGLGIVLLFLGAALLVAGSFWLSRIVKIKV